MQHIGTTKSGYLVEIAMDELQALRDAAGKVFSAVLELMPGREPERPATDSLTLAAGGEGMARCAENDGEQDTSRPEPGTGRKLCLACQKEFKPRGPRQKLCDECGRNARLERGRKWRMKKGQGSKRPTRSPTLSRERERETTVRKAAGGEMTLKASILEVLEEAKGPLNRDEVLARLTAEGVKITTKIPRNTVQQNLCSYKGQIDALGDGTYGIAGRFKMKKKRQGGVKTTLTPPSPVNGRGGQEPNEDRLTMIRRVAKEQEETQTGNEMRG